MLFTGGKVPDVCQAELSPNIQGPSNSISSSNHVPVPVPHQQSPSPVIQQPQSSPPAEAPSHDTLGFFDTLGDNTRAPELQPDGNHCAGDYSM